MAFKLKLEEIVGDFGSALTRKHKHLVPAYSHREVATRWRNLTTLGDLMDTGGETINVNTFGCSVGLGSTFNDLPFVFVWLFFFF